MGTKNRHRRSYSQHSPSLKKRNRAKRTLNGERIGGARLNELLNQPAIQGDASSTNEGSTHTMGSNSMAEALQKAENLFKPAQGNAASHEKPNFEGKTRFKSGITINGATPINDKQSGNEQKMATRKGKALRRFTEEQQQIILRDADEQGVAKAARKHKVVTSLIYQWRAKRKKIDEAGGPVVMKKTAKTRKPDGEPTKLNIPTNGTGVVAASSFDLQMRDEEISFLTRKNKLLEAELSRLRHDQ